MPDHGPLARQVEEVTVTPDQHTALLKLFAEKPHIGHAKGLRDVGVEGTTGQLRAYIAEHPELVEDIDDAKGKRIRTELFRRAIEGVEEPVYTPSGNLAGHKIVYSDRLLDLLARMTLPEAQKLRNGHMEVTGADGGPMEVSNPDVANALERLHQLVAAAAVRAAARTGAAEDPANAVGAGTGTAGLPVGRVAGEIEPGAAAG